MLKKIVGVLVAVLIVAGIGIPMISGATEQGRTTLDVIVLGGQSNAAYTLGTPRVDVDVTNQEIPLPDTNCYYFGTSSRPIYHSSDVSSCRIREMVQDGAWHIGSEEAPIAYQVSKKTHDDVLIINTAVPGQPIRDFLPETGQYGPRTIEVLNAALAQIPSTYSQIRCAWVWIQGEADKSTSVEDYVDAFHTIQEMYASYGFQDCYLVETRAGDSGNARQAHEWLIANDPHVYLGSDAPDSFSVAGGTLVEGNEIHYTQKGRNIVGTDVGEAIAGHMSTHTRDLGPSADLISIVPILMVVGIVLAAITMFIRNRE